MPKGEKIISLEQRRDAKKKKPENWRARLNSVRNFAAVFASPFLNPTIRRDVFTKLFSSLEDADPAVRRAGVEGIALGLAQGGKNPLSEKEKDLFLQAARKAGFTLTKRTLPARAREILTATMPHRKEMFRSPHIRLSSKPGPTES